MPLSTDLPTTTVDLDLGHTAGHNATNTRVNAIATEVNAHEADTTDVHGIADTSALATTAAVAAAYQPLDSDLTAVAALSPSNDDLIQRKAGAWTSRTPAQVKTDLALTSSDVGLGSVVNAAQVQLSTVDAKGDLLVGTAADTITRLAVGTNDYVLTADSAQASGVKWAAASGGGALDQDLVDIAALSPSNDDLLQRKSGAWTNRTVQQVKDDLAGATSNIAFGLAALDSLTSGTGNAAFGADALTACTSGSVNAAFGADALQSLTTGNYNVAVGQAAGSSATTASDNVLIGRAAGEFLSTGSGNMAIGAAALSEVGAGYSNVAIGVGALSHVTGQENVGVGPGVMGSAVGASSNVAIGNNAMRSLTSGNNNVAIGNYTGWTLTTGGENVAIGVVAGNGDGSTSTPGDVGRSIMIGANAQAVASNVAVIGGVISGYRVSLCLGNYGDQLGGGVGVFSLANAATNPSSDPSGGGILYSDSGALKWRGSSGTTTTIAPA